MTILAEITEIFFNFLRGWELSIKKYNGFQNGVTLHSVLETWYTLVHDIKKTNKMDFKKPNVWFFQHEKNKTQYLTKI